MKIEYPFQYTPHEELVEQFLPTGLVEATDFMEKERIGHLAVGSSCCTLNGDLMRRPNDIDILLLSESEQTRLRQERAIDEYNQRHVFKVDDKLTRLGTIFMEDGTMYIHGNGTHYKMRLPQPQSICHVEIIPPRELIMLSKTLVDGRTDDVKANRIIHTLAAKSGIDSSIVPLATRVAASPRDQTVRSIAQYENVIQYALNDLRFQGGGAIRMNGSAGRLKLLALRRKLQGRLVIPFSGGDPDFIGSEKYEWLHQRWTNFGRNIFFHQQ